MAPAESVQVNHTLMNNHHDTMNPVAYKLKDHGFVCKGPQVDVFSGFRAIGSRKSLK